MPVCEKHTQDNQNSVQLVTLRLQQLLRPQHKAPIPLLLRLQLDSLILRPRLKLLPKREKDVQLDLNLILLKARARTVHLEIGQTKDTIIIHMSPLRLGIGTILHGGVTIIGIGHLLVVG